MLAACQLSGNPRREKNSEKNYGNFDEKKKSLK